MHGSFGEHHVPRMIHAYKSKSQKKRISSEKVYKAIRNTKSDDPQFNFLGHDNIMSPEGPPSVVLILCNKLDFEKAQMVPLLHFRHYETVSIFSFLSEIFNISANNFFPYEKVPYVRFHTKKIV